jgi:hypothetical protein
VGLLALGLNLLLVSRLLCDGDARRWFTGDPQTQRELADRVARFVLENEDPTYYDTGILRFDGQSAVATDQMALLGLGQIVLAHPELRERYLPAMRRAADRLADPRQLRYAARVYGQSGLVRMDPGEGHAYLGYLALGLGMMRRIEPETRHAALHDRLVSSLSSRLYASDTGLVETYPGESWPPDVAAVAGAIGLHLTATGTARPPALDAWAERFARCSIEPTTGWLRQHTPSCGHGAPRGSGTAVAGYFLSFSHPELARRLHGSLTDGERSVLGFGALREYPAGFQGDGDVDSGPVIFGVSVGATGFGLGSARASGDRATFVRLYRTTRLFGVPMRRGDERTFVVGGALGNALLLAMLTAEDRT